jgi:hypothetical protein
MSGIEFSNHFVGIEAISANWVEDAEADPIRLSIGESFPDCTPIWPGKKWQTQQVRAALEMRSRERLMPRVLPKPTPPSDRLPEEAAVPTP